MGGSWGSPLPSPETRQSNPKLFPRQQGRQMKMVGISVYFPHTQGLRLGPSF